MNRNKYLILKNKGNSCRILHFNIQIDIYTRGLGFESATRELYGILTYQNDNLFYSGDEVANQYHGQVKLINFQSKLMVLFEYQDDRGMNNFWLEYVINY
ncbi:unnamed protein product [Paramecium octaurelia]|uniref:Uncharacterized protein n=1 Tax=Paramecium octaurelia TaxID=43137 RepID=A0A8S1W3T7_PAROT|nr:unnamed protein product [Paramecium octaurelia]